MADDGKDASKDGSKDGGKDGAGGGGTAAAGSPSVASLLPTVSDAPKGEVTLGDKAGALGPWRAHRVLDAVAGAVATAVHAKLPAGARVLVVDDRSVLQGDWTARQVNDTLTRLTERIGRLQGQIAPARTALEQGIEAYEKADAEEAPPPPPQHPPATDSGTRGTWQAEEPTPPATPSPAPVGVTGALGGALDMLSLLRTDYTVTASAVSAGPAELVTLTAAHLAGLGVAVESDAFSTAFASPSRSAFAALGKSRDAVVDELAHLQSELAPVEAELTAIKARIDDVEKEWASAAGDAKGEKTTVVLRDAADRLTRQARRREKVAAPARTFVASAVAVLAEVDAATTALATAPAGGEAPLFTAARRERLDAAVAGQHVVKRVLYVNVDALAADTVTRRSLLGASGVVRFLSAGNASWLLMDPGTGAVTAGGQRSLADLLTLGLSTGKATYDDVPSGLTKATVDDDLKDPLEQFETPARYLVAALAVFLAAAGVISLIAVVVLAFR